MMRLFCFLIVVLCNGTAIASCLDIDDKSSVCRYLQGDMWCHENNNDAAYAYISNCDDSIKLYDNQTLFKAFKVPVYSGKSVEPNFQSNPKAAHFRTRIKESVSAGVNFAGQYTIVEIGCGTACLIRYMVDVSNGDIFNLDQLELDSEYHADSRLIISNDEQLEESADYLPIYLLWDLDYKILKQYQIPSGLN